MKAVNILLINLVISTTIIITTFKIEQISYTINLKIKHKIQINLVVKKIIIIISIKITKIIKILINNNFNKQNKCSHNH
jgi:hypothetical protein